MYIYIKIYVSLLSILQEHSKQYNNVKEELNRLTIWQENKAFVDAHNAAADKHGFTLVVNKFSDFTNVEFTKTHNGYLMSEFPSSARTFSPNPKFQLPSSVDWREKGYVTEVKNQGQCAGCWSFSATGSLEGQHFNKTGKLVSLSEQNLIDCSSKDGCRGGNVYKAFQYIKENGGIDTEESYPYEGKDGICRYSKNNIGANCTGSVTLRKADENALAVACASIGPISVAIDASKDSFQSYHSGVYYEPTCSPDALDHAVLVVGYGTENDQDYWLVKNSWGSNWGEEGYIKMARNKENNCGIASEAIYPTV